MGMELDPNAGNRFRHVDSEELIDERRLESRLAAARCCVCEVALDAREQSERHRTL
jgi:hypothetical protein